MLYTGIDLHKRSSYFTTVDEHGKVIKQMKIYNDPLRIINYFQDINDQQKAVCECTIGWYWLVDLLKENNIQISIAHTKMLKAIAFGGWSVELKQYHLDCPLLKDFLGMLEKMGTVSTRCNVI